MIIKNNNNNKKIIEPTYLQFVMPCLFSSLIFMLYRFFFLNKIYIRFNVLITKTTTIYLKQANQESDIYVYNNLFLLMKCYKKKKSIQSSFSFLSLSLFFFFFFILLFLFFIFTLLIPKLARKRILFSFISTLFFFGDIWILWKYRERKKTKKN